jgi:hypothetical protein
MRIINSEVKASTGCSPAQLLYGDAISLQVNMFKKLNKPVSINYIYFRNLVKMQNILLTVAAELQKDTDLYHLTMRKSLDSSNTDIELAVNNLVLWDDPAKSSPKLQYSWQGPFLIIKKEGNEITLQCLINHKTWTTHVNRVRPYFYDEKLGFPSPEETAARDLHEFFVEKIKDHKLIESDANSSRVNSYLFLVAWSGYPNQDTWEPYVNLRKNEFLHKYIMSTPSLKPIQAYVKKYITSLNI